MLEFEIVSKQNEKIRKITLLISKFALGLIRGHCPALIRNGEQFEAYKAITKYIETMIFRHIFTENIVLSLKQNNETKVFLRLQ